MTIVSAHRPGLILIDRPTGFRDLGLCGARNNPDAEKNAGRLLAFWRTMGWPVFHIQHASTEANSLLRPDNPGHEFEAFARPLDGEPHYLKSVNSAFIGTSLERDLRVRGRDELVFCGISTDHCVSTSVRMAANLGFRPVLVADACYTFARITPDGRPLDAQAVHDAHLASLNGEFAQIVATDHLVTD